MLCADYSCCVQKILPDSGSRTMLVMSRLSRQSIKARPEFQRAHFTVAHMNSCAEQEFGAFIAACVYCCLSFDWCGTQSETNPDY